MTLHDEIRVFSHSPVAREEKRPWAGAQRPKDGTSDPLPPKKAAAGVYTMPGPIALGLKLRSQAKKLGLVPGTPRWRAYVLGTESAAARRKSEKAKKRKGGETGLVTPRK
jgi:hypothetical protein